MWLYVEETFASVSVHSQEEGNGDKGGSQEAVAAAHVVEIRCTGPVAAGQMWKTFSRKDSQDLMTDWL